jgi:prevent-host-death family protein
MRSVGLKVLKNKLSEYVRLAASGETVLVTDRNRVVAELVPPSSEHQRLPDDRLRADLIRRGLMRPGKPRSGPPPRMP